LFWRFRIATDIVGELGMRLCIECDTGTAVLYCFLHVRDGDPRNGDVVWYDSPFDAAVGYDFRALARALAHSDFRTHYVKDLASLDTCRPRTILLHQGGLLRTARPEAASAREKLHALVRSGTNLILLADHFFVGTVPAANTVLQPYGIRFLINGADEEGLSRDEAYDRVVSWQQRYHEAVSAEEDVCPHPLTAGVKRLYWYRPSPLVCDAPNAVPLARNPAERAEYFAAAARPGGYVVAVGLSLWGALMHVGWPHDNDRLLANLLLGGDAEAASGTGG
jgi:hypothetical protein